MNLITRIYENQHEKEDYLGVKKLTIMLILSRHQQKHNQQVMLIWQHASMVTK